MRKISTPFNIRLLNLTPKLLEGLHEVNDLNTFDSFKEKFHPKGLFSNEIFGPVGSENRNNKFAYIDIKLPILHPVIYKTLVQARGFYKEIMNGTSYATFSQVDKDFIKSDAIDGDTGMHFFLTHFPKLQLKDSGTERRDQTIRLIDTYRNIALMDKVIVLPAGLRDVEFDNGRTTFDDINTFYKRLISLSSSIAPSIIELDPSMVDNIRFKIQMTVLELYENISERIEGKKKLYLGKWASRRIFNGTRNVITSTKPSGRFLGDPNNVGFNDTVMGLYQMMKSVLPVSIHHLQNSILADIFVEVNRPALLIDPETLKIKEVEVDSKVFDYYRSTEGIEKFITDFQQSEIAHKELMEMSHYLCLTYTGEVDGKKVFKIFRDIDSIPEWVKREDIKPTTLFELMYTSVYKDINNYPTMVTRYPITDTGSIVPTTVKVHTTSKTEMRYELDDNWNITEHIASQFPIRDSSIVQSLSPPISSLSSLGGDFDGDTSSANTVYADESTEEVHNFLQTKAAYVTSYGKFIKSASIDTVKYVFFNMAEDPIINN